MVGMAVWPVVGWNWDAALAQPKKAPIVIGWLNIGSRATAENLLVAFKEGLAAAGWTEGSQVVIEERWAEGKRDQAQPLAEQLRAKNPAVIVVSSQTMAAVTAQVNPKTPIVISTGSDPVAAGIVKSLARPGGMITGLTNVSIDLTEKYIELLLGAVPKLRRVGFLSDPSTSNHHLIVDAARRSMAQRSIEARFAEAARPEEIEPAIARLAKEGAQALVLLSLAGFTVARERIAKDALAHRWPLVAGDSVFAEAGALITYGAHQPSLYRRAAYYVDRILKGANPGELPIEQPTTFELIMNLKTAKALGLTIPQPFLIRVDRMIE